MAQYLSQLEVDEVSLVDRPANSEIDPKTNQKTARARVALFKRDASDEEIFKAAVEGRTQGGETFPRSDYAYTPDDTPSHWKLRLTRSPGGEPDAGIVGAAVAALGKGFRGNKVEIPADALSGVKAKVRAAWRKANPSKGEEDLPEAISKGETTMTLEQIEKRLTDQEAVLKSQEVILKSITEENGVLKTENALVLKMSKKERKLYASMDDEKRKSFMAADDEKKKSMMAAADAEHKEKATECSMDEATKKRFVAAGPIEKAAIIEAVNKKKKDTEAAAAAEGKEPDGDEGDDEETAALKQDLAKSADRINKAEQTLAGILKSNRLESFSKRAESELPHTSGTPVEKGEMLMGLADSLPGGENGEAFKKIFATLKAADGAVSKHFTETGKSGGEGLSSLTKFDAKVEEISKRDSIDKAHAVEKALKEAPALYQEYEREQHQLALKR